MIFSTITQSGLNVTADTTEIPAQYSNNIQFEFVQDTENYSGYTPTVCATLYDSSLIECADVLNAGGNVPIENGIFTIGNQILYQSGYLAIGITLTNGDENVTLLPVIYKVKGSVGGLSPLPPDSGEWQQVVDAYVNTLFETWSTENLTPIQNQLESLVSEAQQLQQTAANQQTQIDNAISVMGDYQIVSEDPVQIQFKKGNGDFGPTVDLGDGLASKSMVNGKYYQSAAEMYSGAASNYGIQVQQIVGAYVQDGTPTLDNPVEPQFNVINYFNTNGGNLFDASKLPTKSAGGATVTNNGDGSFTVSGSGNMTSDFSIPYYLTHEETIKLLKVGNLNFKTNGETYPRAFVQLVNENDAIKSIFNNGSYNITQEMLNNTNFKMTLYINGSSSETIKAGTFKPMLYQDGDGTWYPFNASNTPVSLELRALPDGTADVWEDGNTTTNVAKGTFDGINNNSSISQYTSASVDSNFGYYTLGLPNVKSVIGAKTDCFLVNNLVKVENSQSAIEMSCYQTNTTLVVFTNQYTTKEDFISFLQSNPINVYYALATPTTEPLAIPTLTSYYPFTNAWCDSQVPGMITWNVLTGNIKPDELDPAIQEYVDDNVPELISNYVSQNVPAMITSAINSALASYCPFAVGDIYITMNEENPSTIYSGTTWKQIGEGQTLIGVDADNPTFASAGLTGGSLTYDLQILTSSNAQGTTSSAPGYGGKVLIGNVQGNGAALSYPIDITPPFITCYFWQRTA